MSNPDPRLLDLAGSCYYRLGEIAEAARCYQDAGSFRRAADLFVRLDRHEDAAAAYARAGLPELAAWHLVHYADQPAAARVQLARAAALEQPRSDTEAASGSGTRLLRRRLVTARCEVAEGLAHTGAVHVLEDVCAHLAGEGVRTDNFVEPWAIALAESMGRDDQVALVFAAAVRGRRHGAAERWDAWSRRVLGCELILPAAEHGSHYSPSR